ncbi:MAG: hypothetical protein ABIC04_07585 [Nanoarchaeota archaeon]
MKKNQEGVYGGIIGLIVGIVLFFSITGNQFISKMSNIRNLLGFIIIVLEPTIVGALFPFTYKKIQKYVKNKLVFLTIFCIISGILIYLTVMWFISLEIVAGIVGI